jgi:RNA polymerase sigma-70 factor (ECF subfamily)
MTPTDDQLRQWLRDIALRDDMTAYRTLFLKLRSRLKQFAFSILKSQEEAEELVSDVFIRLWEKRARLHEVESPRLYLYVMTKNMAISRYKSLRKPLAPTEIEWLVQTSTIHITPEQILITDEMQRQIRQAMEELPPRCRLIFKLVKEDGLRYREVAELLHLSIKTIEAQMAIALRRIGKCMQLEVRKAPLAERRKKS